MRARPRPLLLTACMTVLAVGLAVTAVAQQERASYVIVARGDIAADALAAAPLGGRIDAPVVLTEPGVLTEAARGALASADPDVVLIAGGETAISPGVEEAIRTQLPSATVQRFAGGTRYDTAAQIAAQFDVLDPAFLDRDGTAALADRALTADHADVADAATTAQSAATFGGLPPESFSHVWSDQSRAPVAGLQLGASSLNRSYELEVDVPADGFLLITAMATLLPEEGGSDGENFHLSTLLTIDAPADLSPPGALADAIVAVGNVATTRVAAGQYEPGNGTVTLTGVAPVTAGPHTLEIIVGSSHGGPTDTFTAFGRSLTAVFIPHGEVTG